MCIWRNIVTCLRNVRVSSAVLTNQYNFSPRGPFYIKIMSPATTELNWILHIKRSIFLPYFNQIPYFSKSFHKRPSGCQPSCSEQICLYIYLYQIWRKSVELEPRWYLRTDGQTDGYDKGTFCDYENATKTYVMLWRSYEEECDKNASVGRE